MVIIHVENRFHKNIYKMNLVNVCWNVKHTLVYRYMLIISLNYHKKLINELITKMGIFLNH